MFAKILLLLVCSLLAWYFCINLAESLQGNSKLPHRYIFRITNALAVILGILIGAGLLLLLQL